MTPTYPKFCPGALAAYTKARALGISLTIRTEDMKLIADPAKNLDYETREMIRDNRDELMKMMLWQVATTYVEIEARDLGPQVATTRAFEVFDSYVRDDLEDINSTFDGSASPNQFYSMLKKAVEKAVRAAHRASRDYYVERKKVNEEKEREAEEPAKDPPPAPDYEQMTLEVD